MTVEVTNEGTILLDDVFVELAVKEQVVLFAFEFKSEEDTRRFFNTMRASVNNGCVHIHVNVGEEHDLQLKH